MKKLRTFEIIEYLNEKKYCSMADLMEHFRVSPATIHRDIAELTKKKLIQKVHGGVAVQESENFRNSLNSHFSSRIDKNSDAKKIIANEAVRHINDDDIIFLDSSTTAFHLARKIQKMNFSNLTIITNSILIIEEFCLFPPQYILISIGGNFNCQLNSFLGKTAIDNLRKLKIRKAFFSAVGITKAGITTFHENHADFLKEVLKLAEENHLLIDSSKFEKVAIFKIYCLSKINHIISEKPLILGTKRVKKVGTEDNE